MFLKSLGRIGQFIFLAIVMTACIAVGNSRPIILYDEWPDEGFANDVATIIDINLESNLLSIKVDYLGGCEDHLFELHAWTAFLQSIPPQGQLFLSHDSQGDQCSQHEEKLLTFDLTPLNKHRNDPGERPLLLRVYEPVGGGFAAEPVTPLIEWP